MCSAPGAVRASGHVSSIEISGTPGPRIPGDGSFVFEHTPMEVDDEPMVVHAGGCTIRCNYLVIATHNPVMGKKAR